MYQYQNKPINMGSGFNHTLWGSGSILKVSREGSKEHYMASQPMVISMYNVRFIIIQIRLQVGNAELKTSSEVAKSVMQNKQSYNNSTIKTYWPSNGWIEPDRGGITIGKESCDWLVHKIGWESEGQDTECVLHHSASCSEGADGSKSMTMPTTQAIFALSSGCISAITMRCSSRRCEQAVADLSQSQASADSALPPPPRTEERGE